MILQLPPLLQPDRDRWCRDGAHGERDRRFARGHETAWYAGVDLQHSDHPRRAAGEQDVGIHAGNGQGDGQQRMRIGRPRRYSGDIRSVREAFADGVRYNPSHIIALEKNGRRR